MNSLLRTLFVLSWPIVLARASQALIGFCDAWMVAPLGEGPLAAVTTGSFNTYLASFLPVTTVYILQSFTAQSRGSGELSGVHRFAWYGFILAVATQIVVVATVPFLPALLGFMPFEAAVRADLFTYLSIRVLSLGPAVGIEVLANWYGGLGNTRPAMRAGVITLAVNFLANYLLIEPRFGLPGYGVVGAAWASVIGTLAGLATIAVPYALGRDTPPRPERLMLQMSEFVRVLRLGLPHGVNWFLEVVAFAVFVNVVVAHLGTTELAAFNVVMQINMLAFMPAFGLASAGAIVVGEAIGRRRYEYAHQATVLTLAAAATWVALLGTFFLLTPGFLMNVFAFSGEGVLEFIAVGIVMLRFCAVWQVFDAVGLVLHQALRAAGDTTWPMLVRIVIAWVVFIPGGWYFVIHMNGGVVACMLAMLVYLTLMALVVGIRFVSGRWQAINLAGVPELTQ